MYPPTQSLEFCATSASIPRLRMDVRTARQRRCSSSPETAFNTREALAGIFIDPFNDQSVEHDVLHEAGFSAEEQAQIIAHDGVGLLEVDIAHPADVRSDDDLVLMPERMVGGKRSLAKHVERRTCQLPPMQRGAQR